VEDVREADACASGAAAAASVTITRSLSCLRSSHGYTCHDDVRIPSHEIHDEI
jgi:hypothetical protein